MKLLVHLIIYAVMFGAGFGTGIWYYDKYPSSGSSIANAERTAKLQGKIETYQVILKERQSNPSDQTPDGLAKTQQYQDSLDKAQKELNSLPALGSPN